MSVAGLKSVEALRSRSPLRERVQLAAETLRTYVRVRWMLRRHGLDATLLAVREPLGLGGAAGDTLGMQALNALRLGKVVSRTLEPLPSDTRCLTRSLVLTALLARRGVPSRLVIGVRPGPSFAAHAWVECASMPVLPLDDDYHAGRLVEL